MAEQTDVEKSKKKKEARGESRGKRWMATCPGSHVLKSQADLEWRGHEEVTSDILLAVCIEGNDGREGNVQ